MGLPSSGDWGKVARRKIGAPRSLRRRPPRSPSLCPSLPRLLSSLPRAPRPAARVWAWSPLAPTGRASWVLTRAGSRRSSTRSCSPQTPKTRYVMSRRSTAPSRWPSGPSGQWATRGYRRVAGGVGRLRGRIGLKTSPTALSARHGFRIVAPPDACARTSHVRRPLHDP